MSTQNFYVAEILSAAYSICVKDAAFHCRLNSHVKFCSCGITVADFVVYFYAVCGSTLIRNHYSRLLGSLAAGYNSSNCCSDVDFVHTGLYCHLYKPVSYYEFLLYHYLYFAMSLFLFFSRLPLRINKRELNSFFCYNFVADSTFPFSVGNEYE